MKRKETGMGWRKGEGDRRVAGVGSGDGMALLRGELYANGRFLELLGWEPTGDGAGEDAAPSEMVRLFAGGGPGYETTGTGRDGRAVRVEISATKVPFPEDPAVLICAKDITERERACEERDALDMRLRRFMEGFGALTDKLSHEFNNVLTALLGYGSLLKAMIDNDSPLRTYVEQIVDSSERAAALVRSLSAAGRQELSFERTALNAVVRGALSSLLSGGAEVRVRLADKDPAVRADGARLERCIADLALFVMEASPGERPLRIETAAAGSWTDGTGACAVLSISLEGDGEEWAGEVSPAPKERAGEGALRLCEAYTTVRRHGGSLIFSGTGLRMYLPLAVSAEEVAQPSAGLAQEASPPSADGDGAFVAECGQDTVLLADDDPAVRGAAAEALRIYGYTVLEAADGEEAINTFIANRDRVGLLLLDMDMPKRSGKEVYEYLESIYPGTKAIFISGLASESVLDGAEDGRVPFLAKPVAPTELVNKIREVLSR